MISQTPLCVERLRVNLDSATCCIRRYPDRLADSRICMAAQSDYGKPVFDADGRQTIRTKIGFKIEFIVEHTAGHLTDEKKLIIIDLSHIPSCPSNIVIADNLFIIFCAV